MSVVNEPVKDGIGQGRLADNVVPVFDRQLGGDQCRAPVIAVVEDFKQVSSPLIGQRRHSPVIEYNQIGSFKGRQQSNVSPVSLGEG